MGLSKKIKLELSLSVLFFYFCLLLSTTALASEQAVSGIFRTEDEKGCVYRVDVFDRGQQLSLMKVAGPTQGCALDNTLAWSPQERAFCSTNTNLYYITCFQFRGRSILVTKGWPTHPVLLMKDMHCL